jgi:release factor glutamine methyltransferase
LNLLEILKRSTEWLEGRGVESPRLDVELLLAHVLGIERMDLYVKFDRPVTEAEREALRPLLRDRGAGKPVAYLLGEWGFHSLPFTVNEHVLVPRPETEGLVEEALVFLREQHEPLFADVGTGSGCIPISLLTELPTARAWATDISPEALAVAETNAARHGVADRLKLLAGDLLIPLGPEGVAAQLDAVVSNPPYIVRGDPGLEAGVRDHEPEQALFVPGDDPLHFVERIGRQARAALRPGGQVFFEIGYGSGPDGVARLRAIGYESVEVRPDFAGIPRVLRGVSPGPRPRA